MRQKTSHSVSAVLYPAAEESKDGYRKRMWQGRVDVFWLGTLATGLLTFWPIQFGEFFENTGNRDKNRRQESIEKYRLP